ncbi:MAG: hypothetical protein U0795_21425 [Pirellulales bacterium]
MTVKGSLCNLCDADGVVRLVLQGEKYREAEHVFFTWKVRAVVDQGLFGLPPGSQIQGLDSGILFDLLDFAVQIRSLPATSRAILTGEYQSIRIEVEPREGLPVAMVTLRDPFPLAKDDLAECIKETWELQPQGRRVYSEMKLGFCTREDLLVEFAASLEDLHERLMSEPV